MEKVNALIDAIRKEALHQRQLSKDAFRNKELHYEISVALQRIINK